MLIELCKIMEVKCKCNYGFLLIEIEEIKKMVYD